MSIQNGVRPQLSLPRNRREDHGPSPDRLAEQKTAKTLELLGQITEQLNAMSNDFHVQQDEELEALNESPAPADIVDIIDATDGTDET